MTRGRTIFLATLATTLLAACAPAADDTAAGTTPADSTRDAKPPADAQVAASPKDATYLIEGTPVTLRNGVADEPAAPGSAARIVTRYFGNEVELDLDSDGRKDTAFILAQESGGSGVFYFAVAALKTNKGYVGTEAVFLGDRIAPQNTFVDPDRPYRFTVTYADRAEGESFADSPSVGVSKTFRLVTGNRLEEVQ